jgi:hypothetical protein
VAGSAFNPFSYGVCTMLRKVFVGMVALLFMAGVALADDKASPEKAKPAQVKAKTVMGSLSKCDAEKNQITLKTADGDKSFDVTADTKFFPTARSKAVKLDLSEKKLKKGANLILVLSSDGASVAEVRLAGRKAAASSPESAPKTNVEK